MSSTVVEIPRKPLFRADEVAEIFGVSRRTIYRWHDEGRIDGIKVSANVLRFERAELIRILDKSE